MKKDTLYIYVRVSTDEQKLKDYSPQRQKELGKKKADELGMTAKVFEEEGASASMEDFTNRPEFFKLLNLVNEGTAKHIFCFDQSRLSRNDITKAVIVNSFRKQGVQLHTFSKRFDMNKAEDVLTFNILQAIEGYESALRKARFALGYVSGNKKGRFFHAIPPYGYTKDKEGFLVVDQEEKKIFLKIVDLYLNHGYGTNQIANYLNEENVQTKTAKVLTKGRTLNAGKDNRKKTTVIVASANRWNPGTINMMFQNELIIGKRKFKTGADSYEYVDVEPLIDQATFDKLAVKRGHNLITKHKEDKYFYLLKDLIVCGVCGNPYHGRIKPNRSEYTYRCNSKRDPHINCGSRGINIDKLNGVVWNSFSTSLYYHNLISKNIQEQIKNPDNLKNRIIELDKEMKKLTADKIKNEASIKNLIKLGSDERIPRNVYNDTLKEYTDTGKKIENSLASCEVNIKMLNQRLQKTKSNESELTAGIKIFNQAEQKITALLNSGKLEDKKNQKEAQQIMKDNIDCIVVSWDEKKKEHIVEIKFMPLVNSNKAEVRRHSIKEGAKVNRIDLPPISYTYTYGTPVKFGNEEVQPEVTVYRLRDKTIVDASKTRKIQKKISSPPNTIQQGMWHL